MATDKDQGDNGEFTYQLNDPEGAFAIDPRSGWLTVRNQVICEPIYFNGEKRFRECFRKFMVSLILLLFYSRNKEILKIKHLYLKKIFCRKYTNTTYICFFFQTVLDREQHSSLRMKVYAKEKNPSIVGTFLDKQRLSKWRRNPTTPRTNTKNKTMYVFPDKIGTKTENIEYFDDMNQLMSFVTVEVTLLDANDNNPVFVPSNLYEFTVKSNAKVGTYIGKVKAVDPDLGRNGMVLYDLQRTSNLTITSPFQVDAKTGVISLAESPVLEGRHALFIEASDQPANPSERRYSLAVVTIDVTRAQKG